MGATEKKGENTAKTGYTSVRSTNNVSTRQGRSRVALLLVFFGVDKSGADKLTHRFA